MLSSAMSCFLGQRCSLTRLAVAYLEIPDDVQVLLLVRLAHVPRAVHHPFVRGQELVEVADAVRVLLEELALARDGLALLDEVEDRDGRAVPREEVVKVLRGGGVERVHDADYGRSERAEQQAAQDALSIGGLGTMAFVSCVQ